MTEKHVRPFLKWAGNKYKVLPRIREALPESRRLIEPFMGSGSLMLNRPTIKYIGGDINPDLISVFNILKQDGEKFLEQLRPLFTQERFDMKAIGPSPNKKRDWLLGEPSFYAARKEFNETTDEARKAALFVFLNQHCFNGLCRYNKYGHFTTPYNLGFSTKGKPAELMEDRFRHAIIMSQDALFVAVSFEFLMMEAIPGDVIYCDPPYLPQDGKEKTFTEYAEGDFTLMQQEQLANLAEKLRSRGVTTIISNHDSKWARKLYSTAEIQSFDVSRSMGRYKGHANSAGELLAIFRAK